MHSSGTAQTEAILAATLLQSIVIILVARGAARLARRFGQPGAVGEIIAGLLLGPSFLGALVPGMSHALFTAGSALPMQVMSQIGLSLLMFQIGSDFEFGHLAARGRKRAVAAIAITSISVPLLAGFVLISLAAPHLAEGVERLPCALFVAVAMAVTAVPILGRILREFQLTRAPVGVMVIAAAATNDVVCWLLLAAVAAFTTSQFAPLALGLKFGGILLFGAVLVLIGQPLVDRTLARHPVRNRELSPGLLAVVIALIFLCGLCTYELGIFVIFGGFAAGLLFHRHHDFTAAWRRQVGQFVLVFFLPIFFTFSGLRTNVLGLQSPADWGWCLLIVLVGIGTKLVPVTLAARLAGLSRFESRLAGILMSTRALMELIVLNVGYDLGFLPQKLFTMLVIMALASTIATAPLLRLAYRRAGLPVPLGEDA